VVKHSQTTRGYTILTDKLDLKSVKNFRGCFSKKTNSTKEAKNST
jgi:hypothetical protein